MIAEKITVKIGEVLAKWLADDQRPDLIAAGSVTVDKDQFTQLVEHARKRHPDFTAEHLEAWAILYITGKERSWRAAMTLKRQTQLDINQTVDWAWKVIVVLLLLAELLK